MVKRPERLYLVYIVEGNMNTDQYVNVTTRLIPSLRNWFPEGDFLFMQDGRLLIVAGMEC